MGLRRAVGLLFAVVGLAVMASASSHPPMAGCPPLTTDPAAITLTPALTVDYCAGTEPVATAFDWFLLLNGTGAVTFVGGITLVSYERLGRLHRALAG